jgi:hypothetical protein
MNAATRRRRILSAAARRLVILAVLAAAPLGALLAVGANSAAIAAAPSPLQVLAEPQAGVTPLPDHDPWRAVLGRPDYV